MCHFLKLLLTPKEGMNISPFIPKSVSCKLPKVSNKIVYCKQSLIRNANYLAKAMNKFVEGSINVERQTIKERMITLLIESNEKLTIKQMEFELKSRKLELESPTQA